jgi:hypothetical protein
VDKFIQIVQENNLRPEAIDRVIAYLSPMSPWSDDLVTQEDIFLNLPYQIACAAHGIRPAHWHDHDVMNSPKILEFMPKIGRNDAKPSSEQEETGAEVIVDGKSFKEVSQGSVCIIPSVLKEELISKFDENNSGLLSSDKRDKLVQAVLNLEELKDVAELMQLAAP